MNDPNTSESLHVFDQALQLRADEPGRYHGQAPKPYWNMVGPYGGVTAATLLRAVLDHPELLGEPLSLTVNYGGGLQEGSFEVHAIPVRTNRSTQHWTLSILQADADGTPVVTTTGSAITAARRETWSAGDLPAPAVPRPKDVPLASSAFGVEWLNRYELRFVTGMLPEVWDGSSDESVSQLWMRDAPPRPLDFCSLAALADVFFPRVWLRRAHRVPAGTVSITIYFHCSQADLGATGDGYLLGQARAQEFRNGFFDQTAQLWNEAGTLLATSNQIVYYKE